MRLADLIQDSLVRGAEYEARNITMRFRLFCLSKGWPENVVNYLSIKQEAGRYVVSIPVWLNDKVNLLEYGDQDTPPSAVIRNFLTNYVGIDDYADGFLRAMKENGV